MEPISRQPWQSVLTTVESGPQPDQETPVRLVLFQAEDLLRCEHWSEKRMGPVRGSPRGGLWPVSSPPPTCTRAHTHPGAGRRPGRPSGGG